MHKLYYFSTLLLFFSCNKQEPIPAYLKIEPFTVNADGGAAWQKIPDVWLYVNTEFLGAYDLPHTIPVLADGATDIQLFAGIKENGITSTPAPYFMMQQFNQQYTLRPGETTVIKPITAYNFPAVKFAWDLDRTTFDNASALTFDNRDADAVLDYRLTTDSAFSGRCLIMPVETAHPLMIIASEPVELPIQADKTTWIELRYLNNVPFVLSLIGSTGTSAETAPIPVFQFKATQNGQWNKIYFNITASLAQAAQKKYRLYFRTELPNSQNKGFVRLDNVRLIHFK